MEFAQRLRATRKSHGMSQSELAKAVGITTRTVQYYEAGSRRPQSTDILISLAKALHVPLRDLVGTSSPEVDASDREHALYQQAMVEYRRSSQQQLDFLLQNTAALLSGGALDESDERAFMRAMNDIYFDLTQRNGVENKLYRIDNYRD